MNSVSMAFIFLDTPEILQYITKRFEDRIWQSGYDMPHKTSIRLFQKIKLPARSQVPQFNAVRCSCSDEQIV